MTTEYKAYEPTNTDISEDELRRRAVKRLQAKAGFWTHLAVYLAVNAFSS
jgi:2TM domain